MKKTKIVCTIGPKTESVETLKELLRTGMNMMRLNFSHGDHEEHGKRIQNFRQAKAETGIRAALLLDNKGPEIRTIKLEGGKDAVIVAGQYFTITTDKTVIGNNKIVAVTYEGLTTDLKAGDTVLIDDGLLEFTVKEVVGNEVRCVAVNNGELGENKGVNLPNVAVNLPALSEKDVNDMIFGCQQGIDYVAASFIRKADDVREVRRVLDENGGKDVQIISKIENQEGVDNFEEILELSDGIMVARGDLGVEIPVEDVPVAQKMMIDRCNAVGKVVITATQMLDSMIKNPRPTRAEVNDVANAILDGTDCIMLSGESANGKYPVEAVRVMTRISEKIDPLVSKKNYFTEDMTITTAVTKGTAEISESLDTKVIVVATQSGRAARDMRRYFPKAEIVAITNNEKTANQLLIVRGITPFIDGQPESLDSFFQLAEKVPVDLKLATKDDVIIANCGESIFKVGTTNSIKLIKIS